MLPWDTEFFGFRVAHILNGNLTRSSADDAETWCRAHEIRCLYFLADFDNPESIETAEDHGFRLVDARISFECMPELRTHYFRKTPPVPVSTRPARRDDLPALSLIARTGYTATRFFFDRRFKRTDAERLYEVWIETCLTNDRDAVHVAELDGQIAGFITGRSFPEDSTGEIGLAGVAANARRAKVGSVLVNAALAGFEAEGLQKARVVTQGRNVPAQRLYQQFGFVTESLQLWYHRWF